MDIECHIEAYPPPSIIWIKDDIILSNNQHYSISHFATADEFTDSTLRVITIEKRQYGDYKCKALNKLGSDEAKAHLFETVIPVCPPACGQAHYTSSGIVSVTNVTASSLVVLIAVIIAFFKK
jgi:neuronal growth regulator 1